MPSPRRAPFVLVAPVVALVAVIVAGACSSVVPDPSPGGVPEAAPVTKLLNEQAAADGAPPVRVDVRSPSRVIARVNGQVVNQRDILLLVGPQQATVGTDEERIAEERRALIDIVRSRVLDRAAVEAGITVTRDELDAERARQVFQIEKSEGTLEKYLDERGQTRREFDEDIVRSIRINRYRMAAMGLGGGDAAMRVRAETDAFPSPKEMRAYFDRNADSFRTPAMARVRVLPVRTDRTREDADAAKAEARERAERALARLRAGEDFVPVFRETVGAEAEPDTVDGLYEIVERGKYGAWIEEFAFEQPRGTLSEVIQKGTTFYVLRAEGLSPERRFTYEEVQPQVQARVARLKRMMGSYDVELSLLEKATIEPRDVYDALRTYLSAQRRRAAEEAGW